jgi:alanyl-tRNA synthetase
MRHHTATHVIMGAARRVLGQHVWQSGAQKEVETSRLDISHFQRLAPEEIHAIEELANEAVMQTTPVETSVKLRTEAERQHGFRLYQGGAVPGKEIRIVKIGEWEVQACGGTHVKNTGEIGLIKILHTERVQDGVERIIFSAGTQALRITQKDTELLAKIAEKLNSPLEKLESATERLIIECKEARRDRERLIKELVAQDSESLTGKMRTAKTARISGLKFLTQEFEPIDVDRMIKTASELIKKDTNVIVAFYGRDEKTARIVIMVGKDAVRRGIDARQIANEAALTLGGGGSGRTEFAQGGGPRPENLATAMKKAEETVRRQLEPTK